MTAVFPIRPNRRTADFIIRRSFWTEGAGQPSRSGREQRRALRAQPRKEVEFQITVTDDCRRTFDRFMVSGQRAACLIAESPRFVTLTAGLAFGATLVDIGQTPPTWIAEGFPVLLVSGARIESRTVSSVIGTVISFSEPGEDAWPAGTKLQPGLTCRLQTPISGTRQSPRGVKDYTIRADVEPGSEPDEDEGSADATFDGREVFLVKPDRFQPFDISLDQPGRERVDFNMGVFEDFHPVAFAQRTWQAQYTACSIAKAEALRQFTARMKGQRGEFFMPSFLADLVITTQANSGTSTLRVAGAEIAADYGDDPVHKAIAVRLADGSWQFNKIASMAPSGGETVLTLSSTWAVNIPVSAQVSWLPLRRLATDTIEEQWPSSGRGARFALPIMTLDYQAAES